MGSVTFTIPYCQGLPSKFPRHFLPFEEVCGEDADTGNGFSCFCADSPEKAMAPHSSTLAWKIPWMEEPGGLQSMGALRVRHD